MSKAPLVLGKVYAIAQWGNDPLRGVQPMVYAIAAEGLHRFISVTEEDQQDRPWTDDWYLGQDPSGNYSQIEWREDIGWHVPARAILGLWSQREQDAERLRANKQRGTKAAETRKERAEREEEEQRAAKRAAREATPSGRLQKMPVIDHVFKFTERSGKTTVMVTLTLDPDRFRKVMKWVKADPDLVEEFLAWDKKDEEI